MKVSKKTPAKKKTSLSTVAKLASIGVDLLLLGTMLVAFVYLCLLIMNMAQTITITVGR